MSWDRIEGQWKQRRGKAVYQWGKVMNDELAAIAGKYEELVGRLQEKYGVAKEETKQQVHRYQATVEQLKKSNSKLMELQHTLAQRTTSTEEKISALKTGKKHTPVEKKAATNKLSTVKKPSAGKKLSRVKNLSSMKKASRARNTALFTPKG